MINFSYNIDKDIENFLGSVKSVNSKKHTASQLKYIEKYGENFTKENLSKFIQELTQSVDMNKEVSRMEDAWRKIEPEFLKRVKNIFGTFPPKEITAFLTTNNRCTYNIEKGYFFVSIYSKSTNRTIMHELFHFYTWYAYGEKLISEGFSKEKYNDIKESLTVILNSDFSDLVAGAIDEGYPQHQGMRSEITKLWSEHKSMDKVIEILVGTSIKQDKLRLQVQELLGKEITKFILKGKGDCNYAYYVETEDGGRYIVKQERERKETEDQNDLVVEGNLLQKLYATNLSTPVPKVVFVSENPKLYGYEYIEGELMRGAWGSLSEDERINICRSLGRFHAEIGKNFTKEMCKASGIDMNDSIEPHPQVGKDYKMLIADPKVPKEFSDLVKEAKKIYDGTADKVVFQFLHNDGHHENVIIKDKEISGIIDFGDSEYGEIAKEFSRYIRDYPDYFKYIISSYEEISGNKLSYARLVSNALISGFIDIVENYWKGGEDRINAEKAMATYKHLLKEVYNTTTQF